MAPFKRTTLPDLISMAEVPVSSEHVTSRVAVEFRPAAFSATSFNAFGEQLTVFFDLESCQGFLQHSNYGDEPLPCGPGRGPFIVLTAPMDEASGLLVTPAKHQGAFEAALRKQGSIDETLWVEFAWCFGQAVIQREGAGAGLRPAPSQSPICPGSPRVEPTTTPLHARRPAAGASPPKERTLLKSEQQPRQQKVEQRRWQQLWPEIRLKQEREVPGLQLKQEQSSDREHRSQQEHWPQQEHRSKEEPRSKQQGQEEFKAPPWVSAGPFSRGAYSDPSAAAQPLPGARLYLDEWTSPRGLDRERQQPQQQLVAVVDESVSIVVDAAPAEGASAAAAVKGSSGRHFKRNVEALRGLACVEMPLEAAALAAGSGEAGGGEAGGSEAGGSSRPKRRRIPPLEAWRNERLEYERLPGSATPSVSRVIRNEAGRRRPGRPSQLQDRPLRPVACGAWALAD